MIIGNKTRDDVILKFVIIKLKSQTNINILNYQL